MMKHANRPLRALLLVIIIPLYSMEHHRFNKEEFGQSLGLEYLFEQSNQQIVKNNKNEHVLKKAPIICPATVVARHAGVIVKHFDNFNDFMKLSALNREIFKVMVTPSFLINTMGPRLYSMLMSITSSDSFESIVENLPPAVKTWASRYMNALLSDALLPNGQWKSADLVALGKSYTLFSYIENSKESDDNYFNYDREKLENSFAFIDDKQFYFIRGIATASREICDGQEMEIVYVPDGIAQVFRNRLNSLQDSFERLVSTVNHGNFFANVRTEIRNNDYYFDFQSLQSGETLLNVALENNHISAVKKIIDELTPAGWIRMNDGPFLPLNDALAKRLSVCGIKMINAQSADQLVLTDCDGEAPLYVAVKKGLTSCALKLIEKQNFQFDATRPSRIWDSLFLALADKNESVASALIQRISSYTLGIANARGITPLELALEKKLEGCALDLIEKLSCESLCRADCEGETPLFCSIRTGNLLAFDELVTKLPKSELNRLDKNGRTLLHVAVLLGHEEIINILLMELNPKDINRPNKTGQTPLDLAFLEKERRRPRRGFGDEFLFRKYENIIKLFAQKLLFEKLNKLSLGKLFFKTNEETIKLCLARQPSFMVRVINLWGNEIFDKNDSKAINFVMSLIDILPVKDLMVVDADGKTLLHLLTEHRSLECIQKLNAKLSCKITVPADSLSDMQDLQNVENHNKGEVLDNLYCLSHSGVMPVRGSWFGLWGAHSWYKNGILLAGVAIGAWSVYKVLGMVRKLSHN